MSKRQHLSKRTLGIRSRTTFFLNSCRVSPQYPYGRNGSGDRRGTIGSLTIAALRAAKAARIWGVEPSGHRRELARSISRNVAIGPVHAAEEILRDTGPRVVDCAINGAAGEHTIDQAIRITRNAGRVVLTGIHSTFFVRMDGSAMRRNELALFNVRRSNHETQEALQLLDKHPEWFAPLLTHTRNIEQIDEAFAIASQHRDGVGKIIVKT